MMPTSHTFCVRMSAQSRCRVAFVCHAFFPVAMDNAVVAEQPEASNATVPAEATRYCRLCGLMRPAANCRLHGSAWECTQCESALRSIRRNLGEQPPEMQSFTPKETHDFFREIARLKGNDKRIQWTTVRSCLITCMTTKAVTVFKTELVGKFLPVSVWVSQGWSSELVERCPCEWNDTLQAYTYMVPVKTVSWTSAHERITERTLKQEQDAADKQKKGKGKKRKERGAKEEPGSEDYDLDLPQAAGSGEKTAGTEKKSQKAAKRTARENEKKAACAAAALPVLQRASTCLQKLLEKVPLESLSGELQQTVQEQQLKLKTWSQTARSTLQLQEDRKADSEEALPELGFDSATVKLLDAQVRETVKGLKPAPKAKAAKSEATAKEGEAKPGKRKTGKQGQ